MSCCSHRRQDNRRHCQWRACRDRKILAVAEEDTTGVVHRYATIMAIGVFIIIAAVLLMR